MRKSWRVSQTPLTSGTASSGTQLPSPQLPPGWQCVPGAQLAGHASLHASAAPSQHCPLAQTGAEGLHPPPGGGWQIPNAHRTVTSNVTWPSPAADSATTRQGPSGDWVVTRNACALPPAPVFTVAVLETPALQWALAMSGSVNAMVSPSMGARVSASSS